MIKNPERTLEPLRCEYSS